MKDACVEEIVLPEIKQLNIEKALEICGSRESLYAVLKTVAESGPGKIERLMSSYEGKDLENYMIEVHAVKSLAASIGCDELSLAAAELEKHAKEGELQYVEVHHESMIRAYMELVGGLEVFFGCNSHDNNVPKKKIEMSMLIGLLNETAQALDEYEDTTAEERLRYLALCDLPGDIADGVNQSLKLLDIYSFDEAGVVVRSMKQQVCMGSC